MRIEQAPANQKNGKQQRQTSAEDESNSKSEGRSGDSNGKLLIPARKNQPITPTVHPQIPGFSDEQMNSLIHLFYNMLETELERRFPALANDRNQSPPRPTPSPVATIPSQSDRLKAEEVGFFDPEYQQDHSNGHELVVNAGKYVYYRDVYVFVDPLKDLANQNRPVKNIITECLRGSALTWYLAELTELERDLLHDTNLDRWYTTLIDRFRMRNAVALSQIVSQTYSLSDIRHTSPRAFVQQMLHLAKSAGIDSRYTRLTLIWNRFAVNLRRDIPEPRPSTTISQFLNQVDSKTSIWMELSQRQPYQPPGAYQPSRGAKEW